MVNKKPTKYNIVPSQSFDDGLDAIKNIFEQFVLQSANYVNGYMTVTVSDYESNGNRIVELKLKRANDKSSWINRCKMNGASMVTYSLILYDEVKERDTLTFVNLNLTTSNLLSSTYTNMFYLYCGEHAIMFNISWSQNSSAYINGIVLTGSYSIGMIDAKDGSTFYPSGYSGSGYFDGNSTAYAPPYPSTTIGAPDECNVRKYIVNGKELYDVLLMRNDRHGISQIGDAYVYLKDLGFYYGVGSGSNAAMMFKVDI